MPSPFVAAAMLIAFVGWFATLLAIKRSGYSARTKYLLMIPSWIPWLVLALGAPMLHGVLSLASAIDIGGAITAGMICSMVLLRARS